MPRKTNEEHRREGALAILERLKAKLQRDGVYKNLEIGTCAALDLIITELEQEAGMPLDLSADDTAPNAKPPELPIGYPLDVLGYKAWVEPGYPTNYLATFVRALKAVHEEHRHIKHTVTVVLRPWENRLGRNG